jgi:hypothetical protein
LFYNKYHIKEKTPPVRDGVQYYFVFVVSKTGMIVPTGYVAPIGACVTDVSPGTASTALRNGNANSLIGPKHFANVTPLTFSGNI